MKRYEIRNTKSGQYLGTYEADNCEDAMDKMARDAGYKDKDDMDQQVGETGLDVILLGPDYN